MAGDINHASMLSVRSAGPRDGPGVRGDVFKYSKYPNAAKEYLALHVGQKEQYGAWLELLWDSWTTAQAYEQIRCGVGPASGWPIGMQSSACCERLAGRWGPLRAAAIATSS